MFLQFYTNRFFSLSLSSSALKFPCTGTLRTYAHMNRYNSSHSMTFCVAFNVHHVWHRCHSHTHTHTCNGSQQSMCSSLCRASLYLLKPLTFHGECMFLWNSIFLYFLTKRRSQGSSDLKYSVSTWQGPCIAICTHVVVVCSLFHRSADRCTTPLIVFNIKTPVYTHRWARSVVKTSASVCVRRRGSVCEGRWRNQAAAEKEQVGGGKARSHQKVKIISESDVVISADLQTS